MAKALPQSTCFNAHPTSERFTVDQGVAAVQEKYGVTPYYRVVQFFYVGGCFVYYASTRKAAFRLLNSCLWGKRKSRGTYMCFAIDPNGAPVTWETMKREIMEEPDPIDGGKQ
jgi:hypothetical protein